MRCADGWEPRPTATLALGRRSNRTVCLPCPAGRAGVGGRCGACSAGQQPHRNRTTCALCALWPHGLANSTHSPAGVACVPCGPGTGPNAARDSCVACSQGRYSARGICEVCEAGYEPAGYPRLAATRCVSCVFGHRGSHSVGHGAAGCRVCPAGSAPLVNRTGCLACPRLGPQFWAPAAGDRCRVCGAGHEVGSSGGSACTPCSVGHVSNGSRCQPCAIVSTAAAYAPADAATCRMCRPGSQPSPDRGRCVPCALGRFSSDGTPCRVCGAGSEPDADAALLGAISCVPCNRTTFAAAVVGSYYCRHCPGGQQPAVGGSSCVPCPAGRAGLSGSCDRCGPGTRPDSSRQRCEQCATAAGVGTYSADGLACVACPAGRSATAGHTQCTICAPGYYSSGSSNTACAVCALGSEPNVIRFGVGATHCVPCLAGSTRLGGACDTCSAGSAPNALGAATGCTVCDVGLHSFDGANCSGAYYFAFVCCMCGDICAVSAVQCTNFS